MIWEGRSVHGCFGSAAFGNVALDLYLQGYDTAAQDVLGDEQWQWLHQQLDNSSARVHLIFSGIQVFHQYAFPMAETWVKFGPAKDRLLELLTGLNVSAPILISGDVHYAEMSRASCLCDRTGQTSQIVEITSSGLTHTWEVTQQHMDKSSHTRAHSEDLLLKLTINTHTNTHNIHARTHVGT